MRAPPRGADGVHRSISGHLPHRSTKTDTRVGDWAAANNVELVFVPFYGSWLNRIEAQFTGLRHFALDGTDHNTRREQASLIRRYMIWRNSHASAKSSNAPQSSSGPRFPYAVLAPGLDYQGITAV